MNYHDYIAIMEAEELTLPGLAEYTLENAAWCQMVIKRLGKEKNFETGKQIKRMEEKKISCILEAIEWARLAKEMPDAFKWADRQIKR